MSDVQTENGFTRVANELLEQIAKFKFNGTEFRIIMIIWRYTYGFNRKSHPLSTSFIAEAIGIDNSRVRKVLKGLIDLNVIQVLEEATFNESRILSFNKNYAVWGVEKDQRGEKEPLHPKRTQPQGLKRTQPQGSKTTPKKETIKDNPKEINKQSRTSVVVDLGFGEIIRFYEKNVGPIIPHIADEFQCMVDENNSELVLLALKKSVEARPKKLINYLNGILRNWKSRNLKTARDVEAHEAANEREAAGYGTHRTSIAGDDAIQSKIDAANERRKRLAGIESDRDTNCSF
ncbi:replication protein [Sporosarcina saromensis]|uniref:Replication protein n=1 Tax=Sporosarcina saromensis TaxID=359365 RepID=A0ABU4G9Z1_9BACL|nr:replication protein [Sporosarcina saromensis]MDW0113804.1 replication protein [Sporosarcina saromensis]